MRFDLERCPVCRQQQASMMMTATSSSFGLDPEIESQLRAMGPSIEADVLTRSRALFSDRRNVDVPNGGARHFDVAYGGHPRQKLDICVPTGRDRPVVLFIPGGGFTGGDKSGYQHVPAFFARQGFVSVVMNYRLAPEFEWPAGAQDVAASLYWIAERIGDCAGDPQYIFVVAQSAGATHAAAALFDPRFRPASHASVRSAVLISGLFRIDGELVTPGIASYFGDDAARYEDRSALVGAEQSRIPVTTAIAELEPAVFAHQSAALAERLTRAGYPPRSILLEGHNHFSPLFGIGGPRDLLGEALVEDLQRHL